MHSDFQNPSLCTQSPLSPHTCSAVVAQIAATGLEGGVHARWSSVKDLVERQRSVRYGIRTLGLSISRVSCASFVAFDRRVSHSCEFVHKCASMCVTQVSLTSWSKETPPPGGFSIYYVPWSRAVCKRFHDEIRRSHLVVKSLTHGSWSGNIVNRKPPRGERVLSINVMWVCVGYTSLGYISRQSVFTRYEDIEIFRSLLQGLSQALFTRYESIHIYRSLLHVSSWSFYTRYESIQVSSQVFWQIGVPQLRQICWKRPV